MRFAPLLLIALLVSPGASNAQTTAENPAMFQTLPQVPDIKTVFRPADPVLVVGDSLVAGYGVKKENSFPYLLGEWTPAKVTAAGKSGETSTQLLKRLPSELAKNAYRWVLICSGGNDLLRSQSDGTLKENLIKMVKMARANQAHPVLIAIPDPRTRIDMPLYREIGSAYRVPVLEGVGQKLDDRHFQRDGVHPNPEGYRIIAHELVKLFAVDPQ